MPSAHALSDEEYRQLSEMIREWKAVRHLIGRTRPVGNLLSRNPAKAVVLLEDLESGRRAKASVLRGDETGQGHLLTVYGVPDEGDTISIEWQATDESEPETVTEVSAFATPAELREKLLEFSFVRDDEFHVQLGNHVRRVSEVDETLHEFQLFRWIIRTSGSLNRAPVMVPATEGAARQVWPGSELTLLSDMSDVIEVASILPVGVDINNVTPMQKGAFAIVCWVDSVGWCVDAIEARSITTDFLEVPIEY